MTSESMYRASDVRGVHLEITTRCNARCPMCPRNLSGGRTKAYLPLVELSLPDIRRILPEDFVSRLAFLNMCGNYGDALTARDTLEVFSYLKAANTEIDLGLMTNGGGRPPDWWRRLAGVVSRCKFGIDGLEDTNHLHRRDVSWPRLMASVEAFIGAGGAAEWDFVVFRHNEHQVEAARELSRRLGFAKFNVRKTPRFLAQGRVVQKTPVLDREGRVEYFLEMPSDPRYINPVYGGYERAVESAEAHARYLETTPVDCKVLGSRQLYISAEGYVFPCCWTGSLYFRPVPESAAWRLIERLPGGLAALDGRTRPIREIVDGPYFRSLVPETWVAGSQTRRRCTICARACGAESPR